MSDATKVITRFAPSPTGYLHVGGARTALFNWLLARHTGGTFLLRIEDTDLARSTEKAVHALLDDLAWLGLHHDNANALVFQSKRLDIYNALFDDLIGRDLAYRAYETEEEIDAMRENAEREKRAFIYRRRKLTDAEIAKYKSENRPHVVRFAMPVKDYSFRDVVLDKDVAVPASQVQDFIIRKTDGMPTYHFAVVVDDAAMKITHVLRGQEHLLNTINHIALQEALGYSRPIYGHLPIILNPEDGSKMGKRDRDKKIRHATHLWMRNTKKSISDLCQAAALAAGRVEEWLNNDKTQLDPSEHAQLMPIIGLKAVDLPEILVHQFRENGYLPEALLNFLALLGWNPGNNRERMSMNELVQLFTLENIGKSNAKFDRAKLINFNTETAAGASEDRLITAFKDYLAANPDSPINGASDEQLRRVLHMKKGFRTLREVDEPARFMFVADAAIAFDPAAVEKVLKKSDGFAVLKDAREILSAVSEWTHTTIESAIKTYCDSKQLGLGKVAQPIRVAVSGGTISPPIFESLEFLGKDRTLARIDRALALA